MNARPLRPVVALWPAALLMACSRPSAARATRVETPELRAALADTIQEVLTFPDTDQPVVRFMWNIGHTITPNGEIAEGNPAEIDESIPLTAENVREYYGLLLAAALRQIAER